MRIDVVPSPNGSQAIPKRGAKLPFGAFTIYFPYGDAVGVQLFAAVAKFCELTIMPLQKLPVPATRLPPPVTCGAAPALHSLGSKFESRPKVSYGELKYE